MGRPKRPKPTTPTGGDSPPDGVVAPSPCSLEELIERNARAIWRYYWVRLGGNENQVDDLMQEFCLQATRSRVPDEDGTDRQDRWLFGLARNVLRRHWRTLIRRRNNIPTVSGDDALALVDRIDQSTLPAEDLHRREVRQALMEAVTDLPGDEQELIFRHYFDGWSQQRLAEELGLTPRAVEGRLYRVRRALREKLRHLHDES